MTHTYFKFNLIALRMIYNHGEFDQYEKYADQCKDLYSAVVAIQEKFEPKAEEIAQKYSKAPYQMWIGSGIVWGEINMFTMCILEEMQWMRTRAATSADFFHGVLELVEKDVPVYLVKGVDVYRPLDERAERFLVQYADDLTVIDLQDYVLPGFSEEFAVNLISISIQCFNKGPFGLLIRKRNWTRFKYQKILSSI